MQTNPTRIPKSGQSRSWLLIPRFALAMALPLWLPTLAAQDRIVPSADGNVSLRLEIKRSVESGVAFLVSLQDPETGAWGNPDMPAFTALSISAILGDPNLDLEKGLPDPAERGYEHLLEMTRQDGGIYGRGLATYNTSLSLMALLLSGKDEHLPVIAAARRFLIGQQQDIGDNLLDGGIGYGGTYTHSDLSNTHFAMEALYYSRQVLQDTPYDDTAAYDLDWDAAIAFVSRTQNTEATIEELGDWAALRDEDRGGFVYFPGDTKSDEIVVETPDGPRTALRSYGSMTYAGLLAFIYAEMDREDPRLLAAIEWLRKNYTLEENPGLDAQGLFYYYHTMSKALDLAEIDQIITDEGVRVRWKEELALELMGRQQLDGSWTNSESNRWMEDDPVLVTAYSLLALQRIHRAL